MADFGHHASKRGLAHFQRVAAHVVAIELDQVESVEEHVPVMLAVADTLERCEPVVIARDGLPIDDARPCTHARQRLGNQRGLPWNIHFKWDSVEKYVCLYVCFSWRRGWSFFREWSYAKAP